MEQCLKGLVVVICFVAVGIACAADELNPKVKFNFLRGKAAFQRNDYQTAVTELQTYLKTDPQNHHALNLLGQAHHKQKNLKEAVNLYIETVTADGNISEMLEKIGITKEDLKKKQIVRTESFSGSFEVPIAV